MEKIIDILNAYAVRDDDGVPTFEAKHNGLILVIDVTAHDDFPTASGALDDALRLARELTSVEGWTPVSRAEIGASIEAFVSRHGDPETIMWRAHVQLCLGSDESREGGRWPLQEVAGLTSDA